MFCIGDVVLYGDYIGVVTNADKLTLALNTGETISPCSDAEISLLASYKEVVDRLERSVLDANR